jgi:hypothetical protein
MMIYFDQLILVYMDAISSARAIIVLSLVMAIVNMRSINDFDNPKHVALAVVACLEIELAIVIRLWINWTDKTRNEANWLLMAIAMTILATEAIISMI